MKRGGSLSFLVGTISNVLVMEIGRTDVGSGGYILVSCAHSNTSFAWHCMKARVCLLTRIMHIDLRLQVGNFGVQHEFLNLWLSNFVPF